MKTLASVAAGEKLSHRGDLRIAGNVGSSASIEVAEGMLIIEGNVGEGARITVTLSETLRHSFSTTGVMHSGAAGSTEPRVRGGIQGMRSVGGKLVFIGPKIRSSLKLDGWHIGDVTVDNRISTDGALKCISPEKFLITAASSVLKSSSRGVATASSASSSSPEPAMVTAKIDGKIYTGANIWINGSMVSTKGMPTPGDISSARPSEAKPQSLPKLQIHGGIENQVSIFSDAAIEVNAIGEGCSIVSICQGITATTVGKATRLSADGAITVTVVEKNCTLTSHKEGVQFDRLANLVIVHARNAIECGDVGDNCVLTSHEYGLTAGNLGSGVEVYVKGAIKVRDVGAGSHFESEEYGLSAGNVADNVVILVRGEINIARAGSRCNILSTEYGISIDGDAGEHNHLVCRDAILVGNLGDNSLLRNEHGKIEVRGRTGKRCIIEAHDAVRLNDVDDETKIVSAHDAVTASKLGHRVTIRAISDIEVSSFSQSPDTCVLISECGKVRRPASEDILAPDVPKGCVSSARQSSLSFFGSSAAASSSSTASPSLSMEPPESLCCPITHELMNDPVICSLDFRTYDRELVTRWLKKHRRTPFNVDMKPEQQVDDILFPNLAIKAIIDAYKAFLANPDAASFYSCS
ncbi:U-box domain protein [Legionella geestiana]|uniref:U-box domain protein n=1 Tax=Legionella geestiana TaxID=45065 RepID=A0A0W0TJR1_9GAMM|nr:U-box domain-containing protein [Legionella geestiana]KTC95855.1 U-box domain protein [Legionella geestiana]QBS13268.1 hypothetical protein E4T54_11220 [Legionella geestiana]STX54207.1 Ribosomal protein L16/L10E [Legionella geestiana]